MKRLFSAVIAATLVFAAGAALAADTTNLSVTANVLSTCLFNAAPADLAFGALDPNAAVNATAGSSLSFWCTQGAAYTLGDEANPAVGDGSFNGTLSDGGGNTIPYSIAYDNFSGNGAGRTTAIVSNLTGTILNADYINAAAGNYTDTVTFTINP